MQKIAVFGGTFHPIHRGHEALVVACQRAYCFDKILMVPTNIPPHKSIDALSYTVHRLAMCQLVAEKYPFLQVSDIEIKRAGISYSIDTLAQLQTQFKDARISLLVGSDMLYCFDQWKQYERILRQHQVIAAARNLDEYHLMQQKQQALATVGKPVALLEFQAMVISSSELREKIKAKQDVSVYLDEAVLAYVMENGLYGFVGE